MKTPRPQGARKIRSKIDIDKLSPGDRPATSSGYFKSFDDTRLFYSSEGTGKPLIFCYGLVCSSLHWTYQIDHFRHSHKAIYMDYRAHHNSDVPQNLSSLSVENNAKDLECLFEELNLDKAILLGHSMGVNVVLDFYRRYPDKVEGMILSNGTARRPLEMLYGNNVSMVGFRFLRKAFDFTPEITRRIWRAQTKNKLTKLIVKFGGFNPHLTPNKDVERYVEQVGEFDPEIFLNLIEDYENYDATPWLHEVDTPTLIISGRRDQMTPMSEQELMHQLIPGSKHEIIEQGAHCAPMDMPELVNQKIGDFLSGINY